MSLSNYQITDAAIAQKGVVAAPDKLTGTAEQNKMVFDRLIREAVKGLFNGLIDELSGTGGAGEIGTTAITGVTGGDVQTVLGSLKTILDTKSASADMEAALALKSNKAVTDLHLKSVTLNAETGVFTFTREDGSFFTIDTVLEKVATNWQYNADTQSLVLTLADGTTQSVPLSAFITETEFSDSAQIAFSVSNHNVTATVKAGSITDTMLASALIEQLEGYVSDAADSATDAEQSATAAEGYKNTASEKAGEASGSATAAAGSAASAGGSATLSESYAKGGTNSRTGEDTDNAKYFKERADAQASAAAGSATAADGSAEDAEAWAVGQRGGVDVPSTDPAYHNNAKYYKEQAREIVGGDYATEEELSTAVSTHNGASDAHSDIRQAVSQKAAESDLTSHTGNGNIHVTAADKTAWSGKQEKIKTVSISMSATWVGDGPYTQTVTVTGGTANILVELQPTDAQLDALEEAGVTSLRVDNNNGTFTATARGAAPAAAMTIQAVLTEVSA